MVSTDNDPNDTDSNSSINELVYFFVSVVGLERSHVLRGMDELDREAAIKAYELGSRDGWERTRLVCYHVVAPYLKKSQNVKSFMPFEWDKAKGKEAQPLTRDQFEELKKRRGLK